LKQGRSLGCGLEGGAPGGRLKMRGKWLERGRSGVWPAEGRSEFALGRLQQGRKCRGWSKRGTASACRGGFLFQGREWWLGEDELKGRGGALLERDGF